MFGRITLSNDPAKKGSNFFCCGAIRFPHIEMFSFLRREHATQLNPYGFAWLHLQPSRRPRGKRYLSARASLYPNHDASFSLTRVARSGDVAINPGPDPASTATIQCKHA